MSKATEKDAVNVVAFAKAIADDTRQQIMALCCGKLKLTFAPEQNMTQTVRRELRNK